MENFHMEDREEKKNGNLQGMHPLVLTYLSLVFRRNTTI
jgi:hypothetical protein